MPYRHYNFPLELTGVIKYNVMMLKVFRNKNVAKIVLWALLILILPAFVLWGTGNLGRGADKKGPAYVGTIENKKVSFDDFAKSVSSIRCQIVLNYFNNSKALDSLLKNKAFVGKLAWDRLIMLKKAGMARIRVPDSDVIKFITSHPLFLRNGRFDDRVYEYFLKNSLSLYPRNFEELIRETLMIQKLTDSLTKDIKVTDEEVLKDYEMDNSKFKISYILIPLGTFTDKISIPEAEIKDFYEKHKQEFVVETKETEGKAPTARMLSFDEINGTIKAFLSENKARPLATESANKTCEGLSELMAKNKLSFAAAAAKLGFKAQESQPFTKSDRLEGIGDAGGVAVMAAKMKKDEISKPADTRTGVLIFTVVDVQPFDQEKFKKEKDDFAKKVLTDKKNAFIEDWLREHEKGAELKIDLNEYDKYYR